jgi:hypothetical protein
LLRLCSLSTGGPRNRFLSGSSSFLVVSRSRVVPKSRMLKPPRSHPASTRMTYPYPPLLLIHTTVPLSGPGPRLHPARAARCGTAPSGPPHPAPARSRQRARPKLIEASRTREARRMLADCCYITAVYQCSRIFLACVPGGSLITRPSLLAAWPAAWARPSLAAAWLAPAWLLLGLAAAWLRGLPPLSCRAATVPGSSPQPSRAALRAFRACSL